MKVKRGFWSEKQSRNYKMGNLLFRLASSKIQEAIIPQRGPLGLLVRRVRKELAREEAVMHNDCDKGKVLAIQSSSNIMSALLRKS